MLKLADVTFAPKRLSIYKRRMTDSFLTLLIIITLCLFMPSCHSATCSESDQWNSQGTYSISCIQTQMLILSLSRTHLFVNYPIYSSFTLTGNPGRCSFCLYLMLISLLIIQFTPVAPSQATQSFFIMATGDPITYD